VLTQQKYLGRDFLI